MRSIWRYFTTFHFGLDMSWPQAWGAVIALVAAGVIAASIMVWQAVRDATQPTVRSEPGMVVTAHPHGQHDVALHPEVYPRVAL